MKQIMNFFSAAAFILLTGLVGVSGSAVASTPDGQTPANEGVCDGLMGATPGLYGLCVAYCEAQDLESIEKGPPNVKILANYKKKQQPGDPDMPCVQTPCPCYSDAELASIAAKDGAACTVVFTIHQLSATFDNPNDPTISNQHTATVNPLTKQCSYIDETDPLNSIIRNAPVNTDEQQLCIDALLAACP